MICCRNTRISASTNRARSEQVDHKRNN
jgi:hypothetical protein